MQYQITTITKMLVVSSLLGILTLNISLVKAQDNVIYSRVLENEVIVDGFIEDDEWTDANKYEMEPFFGIGADFGSSYIYVKNDVGFLYLLCDQAYGTEDDLLIWALGFDADNNDNWTPEVDAFLNVTYNETEKPPWSMVFQLAYEIYPFWSPVEESGITWNGSFGTSEDITGIHPILEMKIPLALIGVNGSEGGTVGFQFIYGAWVGEDLTYVNCWPTCAWPDPDYPQPPEDTIARWGDLVIPGFIESPDDKESPSVLPGWVLPTIIVVVINIIAAVIIIAAVYRLRH